MKTLPVTSLETTTFGLSNSVSSTFTVLGQRASLFSFEYIHFGQHQAENVEVARLQISAAKQV